MQVIVNGREETISPGTTVRALIERLGMGTQACAAEVNESLIPRREQESRELKDGDRVELVTLVGGG